MMNTNEQQFARLCGYVRSDDLYTGRNKRASGGYKVIGHV